MSAVQYHFPANPLAASLRAAKPRTSAMGLREAQANLDAMADECLDALDERLARLEMLFARWPSERDEAFLAELYKASVSLIGVAGVAGFPTVEQVALSLCDVLDGLLEKGLWRQAPVAVHLHALRLLRDGGQDPPSAAAMLDGLAKVRALFTPAAEG